MPSYYNEETNIITMTPEQPRCDDSHVDRLVVCPACRFGKDEFEKHNKQMESTFHGPGKWDNYKPVCYKDRLTEKWVVECQNCGMDVIFHEETEEETIQRWNKIPRAT